MARGSWHGHDELLFSVTRRNRRRSLTHPVWRPRDVRTSTRRFRPGVRGSERRGMALGEALPALRRASPIGFDVLCSPTRCATPSVSIRRAAPPRSSSLSTVIPGLRAVAPARPVSNSPWRAPRSRSASVITRHASVVASAVGSGTSFLSVHAKKRADERRSVPRRAAMAPGDSGIVLRTCRVLPPVWLTSAFRSSSASRLAASRASVAHRSGSVVFPEPNRRGHDGRRVGVLSTCGQREVAMELAAAVGREDRWMTCLFDRIICGVDGSPSSRIAVARRGGGDARRDPRARQHRRAVARGVAPSRARTRSASTTRRTGARGRPRERRPGPGPNSCSGRRDGARRCRCTPRRIVARRGRPARRATRTDGPRRRGHLPARSRPVLAADRTGR